MINCNECKFLIYIILILITNPMKIINMEIIILILTNFEFFF